jgi:HEAT repeat protein
MPRAGVEGREEALRQRLQGLLDGPTPVLAGLRERKITSWRDLAIIALDPSEPVRQREISCWLLGELGDTRAVHTLLRLFREPEMLPHAAIGLGILGSRRAVRPLIQALRDGSAPDERAWAAYALGLIRDERACAPLLEAFRNTEEDPKVRGDAAEALAYLFAYEAVPALREALAQSSVPVRFWAMFALGQLAGPDVIPDLERIAATDDAIMPGYWSLRKEALDMIESIRGRAQRAQEDEEQNGRDPTSGSRKR